MQIHFGNPSLASARATLKLNENVQFMCKIAAVQTCTVLKIATQSTVVLLQGTRMTENYNKMSSYHKG